MHFRNSNTKIHKIFLLCETLFHKTNSPTRMSGHIARMSKKSEFAHLGEAILGFVSKKPENAHSTCPPAGGVRAGSTCAIEARSPQGFGAEPRIKRPHQRSGGAGMLRQQHTGARSRGVWGRAPYCSREEVTRTPDLCVPNAAR